MQAPSRDPHIRQQVLKTGFWFVDIPRTSSSAVSYELGQHFGATHGKASVADAGYGSPQILPDHLSARQMQNCLGAQNWAQLFTFSIIRNPWDRAVSFYFYRKTRAHVRIPEDWSLADYLGHVARARQGDVHALLDYAPQYMSCSDFLTDAQGQICVDEIVRYEDRAAGLARIGARIGVPGLGRALVNAATPRDQRYTDHYDARTRALVGRIFEEDCVRFGYRFDAA